MKNRLLKSIELHFVVLTCLALPALNGCAGKDEGLAAYKRGDYAVALNEYQAEGGPSSDFALGVMYYKGQGVKRDTVKAAAYFQMAAEHGHAGAQYNLGLMYYRGIAVPKDNREAARWYTQAAEQGYDKAQYNLGLMYARGDGVETDRRKALQWLAKSARQGNTRALKCLKAMLDNKAVKITANN